MKCLRPSGLARETTLWGVTGSIPTLRHSLFPNIATDKLLHAKGCGSIHPGRFRDFMGVRLKRRYCYPPVHPANKKRRLLNLQGPSAQERSAASLAATAKEVEASRRAGNTKKAVNDLALRCVIKGYSVFHVASPEDNQRYPYLGYLWALGQATFPYDTMHLLFCNVVPLL